MTKKFLFSDSPEVLIKTLSRVVEGDSLSLTCLVAGNPPPDVLWIKGSDNSVITKNSTIVLPSITRTDSGLFQCLAWNGIGKNASSNVTVDVLCEYLGTVHLANQVKSWFGW